MTLRIGRAIGRGIRRANTPTGYLLMVLGFAYTIVFVGSMNTLLSTTLPPVAQDGEIGLILPIPTSIAGVLMVLGIFFGLVVYIAAARGLTRDPDELAEIPTEIFTRRIGRAVLSTIGAGIIVSIAVTIGFALLIIPGLFLAVSFAFVVFVIGVEDERAIGSLRRSWQLARGNRWRLLGLVLIVGIGTGAIGGLGSLVSVIDYALGQVVSFAVTSVLSVIGYGIFADAYLQVREPSIDDNTQTRSGDDNPI